MSQDNKNSHINRDEREIIETGIEHGSTKQAIADTIGKDQSKKVLKGKSPIEMMKFLKPELYERLKAFGIEEIDKDKIILKPYLLK